MLANRSGRAGGFVQPLESLQPLAFVCLYTRNSVFIKVRAPAIVKGHIPIGATKMRVQVQIFSPSQVRTLVFKCVVGKSNLQRLASSVEVDPVHGGKAPRVAKVGRIVGTTTFVRDMRIGQKASVVDWILVAEPQLRVEQRVESAMRQAQ